MLCGLAARTHDTRTDELVSELPRDGLRLRVALHEAALGYLRVEPVEGERQDRGTHFGAETLALPLTAEPRPGADAAPLREALRADALRPDRLAVPEGDQLEVPVVRRPVGEPALVVFDETVLREVVCPGDAERHELRIVDPGGRDLVEAVQLGHRGKPQLESRCAYPQPGQRVR